MGLLPLDEVRRRLRITGQAYAGVRPVPLERIVGSVDRSADFGRGFKARRRLSRARLARLREAFPDGDMPPIDVYEAGGAFFVSDGHHRVALARERGADFLDADVTVLHTNYALPPDVDVAQLVHTEQQRRLLEESGLARARPGAIIEFARPRGYPEPRIVARARWSAEFTAATPISRSSAVSRADQSRTSRRISTARWRGGSSWMTARNVSSIVSRATTVAPGSSSGGASSPS